MQFDADRHGDLALGLEGGHSRRRIIHAGGSATGRRILRGALRARSSSTTRSRCSKARRAAAILEHGGVRLEDGRDLTARATILATGGAAALWSRTTNPPGSFGSGLLLARQAGAMLADLEFTQFHPTAVVGLKGREGFLISEAVRGEGATLHDPDGERFVNELDPRDAVARAIYNLLRRTGATSVGLDMTMVDPGRFPNIVSALQEAGLDPTTQRVPVAPASHYVMGGIVTDLDGRATGVERLYAVGECACTGLHGANRLASNSLSECFVFGRRAALEGPRRARARRSRTARRRPRSRRRPARPARPSGALAGLERNADDLDDARERPAPARPARRRLRARPARRRAARTPAPSSPSSTRPSTATTRSSTPAPTPRASSRGPPDRLGRRADDEHAGLLRRLRAPRGASTSARRSGTTRDAREALVDLETRHGSTSRRSSAGSGGARASTPTTSRSASPRDVRPDQEMLDAVRAFHDRGVPHRARQQLVARRTTTTSTTSST